MDGQRFDDFIRGFGAERSRRSVFARLAQGGFAAALAAVGLSQGTLEESEAAQLEADANQEKCRRRCQKAFRRRRKRGVRLNKLRSQRRRCFRRCRSKQKATGCTMDVQCAYGRICDGGACVVRPCTPTGGECTGGRVCRDEVCVPLGSCSSENDCGSGENCVNNRCEADPNASCTTDGDCGLLSVCDSNGQCASRTPCEDDGDCAVGICLLGLGVCVDEVACGVDNTCPDGQLCVAGICLGATCLVEGILGCKTNADCCADLVCQDLVLTSVCLPQL